MDSFYHIQTPVEPKMAEFKEQKFPKFTKLPERKTNEKIDAWYIGVKPECPKDFFQIGILTFAKRITSPEATLLENADSSPPIGLPTVALTEQQAKVIEKALGEIDINIAGHHITTGEGRDRKSTWLPPYVKKAKEYAIFRKITEYNPHLEAYKEVKEKMQEDMEEKLLDTQLGE